jgi:hypothetical protein
MRGQTIHHAMSRKVKHISVITRAFAAEESFIPDMMRLRDFPLVREQLKKPDVRFGTDLVMKSNAQPHINAEIFLEYVQTVLLSNRAKLRRMDGFAEEMAVLLMDNGLSHISSDVIALFNVITFAPHTTQIFQVLDVILFSVRKRRPRYELPFEDGKTSAKFIMKVSQDIQQTMMQPSIWGAFQALGFDFEFDTTSEPYRLFFNKEKLREGAGLRELWCIDFPLDQLSTRRRAARFG